MSDGTRPPMITQSQARGAMLTSRRLIQSMKTRANKQRTVSQKFAERTTRWFGSMAFLIINTVWFVVWIIWNVPLIPGLEPFDPFPFELLTTIVSLEAILLAIFVLISQNRAERVADLRQEADLQIDILTEDELTKMMRLLILLLEKHGIDTSADAELQAMLLPTNLEKLERTLEAQIDGD